MRPSSLPTWNASIIFHLPDCFICNHTTVAVSFQPIRSLLQAGTRASSRWFSYVGLGIGVLLLLCSIQMYINIQQLLGGESARKEGYDFISISKTITNETMGQLDENLFNEKEIQEVAAQPFIE